MATIELEPLTDTDIAGSDDEAPKRCAYEGCVNQLVLGGRGRPPKFCPEHKGAKGNPSGNSKSPTGTKLPVWAMAPMVEDALKGYLSGLGFIVTIVNPADGAVLAEGTDAVARAIVNLGKKNKGWRKTLERMATPGQYGELIFALTPIIIGLCANHGLLPQFNFAGLTPDNGKEG